MPEDKRQFPRAERDREVREAPIPSDLDHGGDIGHDNSGIANDRESEDDRASRLK